ncbi:hypothetical protein T492DRAFT_1103615 [Pavlovales sp. CCMP2436]|nr:hypothetical protein T492DRAFT_1103615 [Pavlovales sp. CCMP2436]
MIALSRRPRRLTGWLAVLSSALPLAAGVPRPHRWARPHGAQDGPLRAPAPAWRAQHAHHFALRASASAHEEGLKQELEADALLNGARLQVSTLCLLVAETIGKEERKQQALRNELEQVRKSDELSARAELVIGNLHAIDDRMTSGRELRLADLTNVDEEGTPSEVVVVVPKNYDSAHEWAEATFKKARRMRRGVSAIEEILDKSDKRTDKLLALRARADDEMPQDAEDVDAWLRLVSLLERDVQRAGLEMPAAAANKQTSSNNTLKVGDEGKRPSIGRGNSQREWAGRRFMSPDGIQILNEALALSVARAPDLWMHVRESPGAHVVMRFSKAPVKVREEELPEPTMQLAANLVAFYSDLRNDKRVSVSVASPKQLFKPRGAPLGAVGVRQELPSWMGFPPIGLSEFDDNFVEAKAKPGKKRR